MRGIEIQCELEDYKDKDTESGEPEVKRLWAIVDESD